MRSHRKTLLLFLAVTAAAGAVAAAQGTQDPAPAPGAVTSPIPPDLTSPENTLRSFAAAYSWRDFRRAGRCVLNAPDGQVLDALQRAMPLPVPVSVSEIQVRQDGDRATATLTATLWTEDPETTTREIVRLVRVEGLWKIVPPEAAETRPRPDLRMPPHFLLSVRMIERAEAFAHHFNEHRRIEREKSCLANLKQLAAAAEQRTMDRRGVSGLRTATWQKVLVPEYLKTEPFCPAGPQGAAGYTFNARLEGMKPERIPHPSRTVLFYEGKGGVLEFRHDGKAGVAFVDGTVALVDASGAKTLRF
jgi:prepilin-type processing-associated H-X9-DG protein